MKTLEDLKTKGLELNSIYNADCLEAMKFIPDKSVDLVLTDPPYGTMAKTGISSYEDNRYKWDIALNPEDIFYQANRLLRKNGKLILFSQEPYTTKLISNATKDVQFCYRMVWVKDSFAVSLGVNRNPVSFIEDILVFHKHFESENNDDNPCKEYAIKVFAYMGKPLNYFKEYYKNNNLAHFYSNGKQFRLCTEGTYNNLIRDFGIDKMNGFVGYEVLMKCNSGYKNVFKSTFNLWEGSKYKSNVLYYKKDRQGLHPT